MRALLNVIRWAGPVVAFLMLIPAVQATVTAGQDYTVLPVAQPVDTKGKIEVTEFFSYGCPHCYDFYPLVKKWETTLPKDVVFKRVAVSMGHEEWANLAKAYYVLEATNQVPKHDGAFFDAIHKQHLQLFDETSIAKWLAARGVDPQAFASAFDSMGVMTHTAHAEDMAMKYRVTAVPTIAVAGRYVVTAQSHADTLRVTDELIAKVRAESKAHN